MRYENNAVFRHVKRDVFNAVADRIYADEKMRPHVYIYYSGSALYGDVTIEGSGGYSQEYKKALQIFNEEYCK